MGKVKLRDKRPNSSGHGKKAIQKLKKVLKPAAIAKKPAAATKKGHNPPQPKAQIPFTSEDRVLLVGEGDFSFALSLSAHHPPAHITATSYDSQAELYTKYPHARHNIDELLRLSARGSSSSSSSSTSSSPFPPSSARPTKSSPASSSSTPNHSPDQFLPHPHRPSISIHHSISALTLPRHRPLLHHNHAPYTKIVFNFPHTGGLSTDVNRQVRANQELLVGFFRACPPLLSTGDGANPPGQGQVLVTLFTGEPYTLWNVKDLARHAGLRVVTSWRFPWEVWRGWGYRHARTLGELKPKERRKEKGKGGEREDGKRAGAWRGEEREARCFVFEAQCADGAQGEGEVEERRGKERERRREKKGGKGKEGDGEEEESD